MRVLVLGGTGMLGHVLARTLADRGHHVSATVRGDPQDPALGPWIAPGSRIPVADLAEPADLARAFAAARPSVVVNAAGMIKQKSADPVALIRLNALMPHLAAAEADRHGARLIHVSTDCVFAGTRGMYGEADPPDAGDDYGQSKRLGEVAAPHLTLRTSLVGWQLRGAESLLAWFWAQRGGRARGFTRAYFSGLSTPAFARILAAVIADHPGLSGLWHVAAPRISKFDLLEGLNDRLGRPVDLVPDDGPAIDRSLDGRRFAAATAMKPPEWPEMLDELAEDRMRANAD